MMSDAPGLYEGEEKSHDSKSKSKGSNDQLLVQRLLEEAGLESVPIDPMSLQALKEYVVQGQQEAVVEEEEKNSAQAQPPVTECKLEDHPSFKRYTSGLTAENSFGDSFNDGRSAKTDESLAGTFVQVEGASGVENQILEQLHRQTRLLLEMQHRMDELTTTVDHLRAETAGGGGSMSMMRDGGTSSSAQQRSAKSSGRATVTPNPREDKDQKQQRRSARRRVTPEERAPARAAHTENNNNNQQNNNNNNNPAGIRGVSHAIRNSRLAKMMILFLALRRRHVQAIDGGLIFKILFMMAILTARMSSSSKRFGNPEWTHKFAFVSLVVVLGFMVQTGYIKYVYLFFIKENYPERIWNGEEPQDILNPPTRPPPAGAPNNNNNQDNNNRQNPNNAAPPLPQGQLPPHHPQHANANNNANNNNNNNNGWRNTFLGGMIPDGQLGGVAGAVQDVVLLFGSFLLSIFPMWQPEGNPNRPPVPRPRAPPQQPDQQQQQPVPPPGGVAAGPGQVRPPRDAMQPVDDDSDDDNAD